LRRIAAETASSLAEIELVTRHQRGDQTLCCNVAARLALVTTQGFEDVIEIWTVSPAELYNLNAVKPSPWLR